MTDLLSLARRAVACKKWRFLPGMQVIEKQNGRTSRLTSIARLGWNTVLESGAWMRFRDTADLLPDFSDPVTAAAVLPLVREAWGDAQASSSRLCGRWVVVVGGIVRSEGTTELEAAIAALEAADAR